MFFRPSDGRLVYLSCCVLGCGKEYFRTVTSLMHHVSNMKNHGIGKGFLQNHSHAIEVCGRLPPDQEELDEEKEEHTEIEPFPGHEHYHYRSESPTQVSSLRRPAVSQIRTPTMTVSPVERNQVLQAFEGSHSEVSPFPGRNLASVGSVPEHTPVHDEALKTRGASASFSPQHEAEEAHTTEIYSESSPAMRTVEAKTSSGISSDFSLRNISPYTTNTQVFDYIKQEHELEDLQFGDRGLIQLVDLPKEPQHGRRVLSETLERVQGEEVSVDQDSKGSTSAKGTATPFCGFLSNSGVPLLPANSDTEARANTRETSAPTANKRASSFPLLSLSRKRTKYSMSGPTEDGSFSPKSS